MEGSVGAPPTRRRHLFEPTSSISKPLRVTTVNVHPSVVQEEDEDAPYTARDNPVASMSPPVLSTTVPAAKTQPMVLPGSQVAPAQPAGAYYELSARAVGMDVARQTWYHPTWDKATAVGFLAPAATGAFCIRAAPQGTPRGTRSPDDLVLSVQTGSRIRHLLLKREEQPPHTGKMWWNVHPTLCFFESLFDLVLYFSVNPFGLKNPDSGTRITLNLAAAVKAAQVYQPVHQEKEAVIALATESQHWRNFSTLDLRLAEQEALTQRYHNRITQQNHYEAGLLNKLQEATQLRASALRDQRNKLALALEALTGLPTSPGIWPTLQQAADQAAQASTDVEATFQAQASSVSNQAETLKSDQLMIMRDFQTLLASLAARLAQAKEALEHKNDPGRTVASEILDALVMAETQGVKAGDIHDQRDHYLSQLEALALQKPDNSVTESVLQRLDEHLNLAQQEKQRRQQYEASLSEQRALVANHRSHLQLACSENRGFLGQSALLQGRHNLLRAQQVRLNAQPSPLSDVPELQTILQSYNAERQVQVTALEKILTEADTVASHTQLQLNQHQQHIDEIERTLLAAEFTLAVDRLVATEQLNTLGQLSDLDSTSVPVLLTEHEQLLELAAGELPWSGPSTLLPKVDQAMHSFHQQQEQASVEEAVLSEQRQSKGAAFERQRLAQAYDNHWQLARSNTILDGRIEELKYQQRERQQTATELDFTTPELQAAWIAMNNTARTSEIATLLEQAQDVGQQIMLSSEALRRQLYLLVEGGAQGPTQIEIEEQLAADSAAVLRRAAILDSIQALLVGQDRDVLLRLDTALKQVQQTNVSCRNRYDELLRILSKPQVDSLRQAGVVPDKAQVLRFNFQDFLGQASTFATNFMQEVSQMSGDALTVERVDDALRQLDGFKAEFSAAADHQAQLFAVAQNDHSADSDLKNLADAISISEQLLSNYAQVLDKVTNSTLAQLSTRLAQQCEQQQQQEEAMKVIQQQLQQQQELQQEQDRQVQQQQQKVQQQQQQQETALVETAAHCHEQLVAHLHSEHHHRVDWATGLRKRFLALQAQDEALQQASPTSETALEDAAVRAAEFEEQCASSWERQEELLSALLEQGPANTDSIHSLLQAKFTVTDSMLLRYQALVDSSITVLCQKHLDVLHLHQQQMELDVALKARRQQRDHLAAGVQAVTVLQAALEAVNGAHESHCLQTLGLLGDSDAAGRMLTAEDERPTCRSELQSALETLDQCLAGPAAPDLNAVDGALNLLLQQLHAVEQPPVANYLMKNLRDLASLQSAAMKRMMQVFLAICEPLAAGMLPSVDACDALQSAMRDMAIHRFTAAAENFLQTLSQGQHAAALSTVNAAQELLDQYDKEHRFLASIFEGETSIGDFEAERLEPLSRARMAVKMMPLVVTARPEMEARLMKFEDQAWAEIIQYRVRRHKMEHIFSALTSRHQDCESAIVGMSLPLVCNEVGVLV